MNFTFGTWILIFYQKMAWPVVILARSKVQWDLFPFWWVVVTAGGLKQRMMLSVFTNFLESNWATSTQHRSLCVLRHFNSKSEKEKGLPFLLQVRQRYNRQCSWSKATELIRNTWKNNNLSECSSSFHINANEQRCEIKLKWRSQDCAYFLALEIDIHILYSNA